MKKSVESLVLSPEVNPKEKNLFSIENSFQNTGKGNIQMYQKEVQFSHEAFEDHIHIYIYQPGIMRTLFLCLWAFYGRNHLISLVTQPFNTYLWSASYVSWSIPMNKVRDINVCTVQWTGQIHKQFQSLVSIIICKRRLGKKREYCFPEARGIHTEKK